METMKKIRELVHKSSENNENLVVIAFEKNEKTTDAIIYTKGTAVDFGAGLTQCLTELAKSHPEMETVIKGMGRWFIDDRHKNRDEEHVCKCGKVHR